MSFIDDMKTDKKTQILVAGMLFFALAFPGYFHYVSGQELEDYTIGGPVGDYTVNGTFTFHEIGSGSELIEHEGTEIVGANSDVGGVEDLNIIGFRITTSHTEDEESCAPAAAAPPQDDEISVLGGINDNTTSYTGTEPNGEGSYFFVSEFLNVTFEEVSSTDLDEMLDGGKAGFGEYTFELGVTVNRGQAPFGACENDDNNEQVDWVIELISLEYTLEMVEADEEEEESEE